MSRHPAAVRSADSAPSRRKLLAEPPTGMIVQDNARMKIAL